MLIIKNLTIRDLKDRVLLESLSFTIQKYDKIAIIGEEGNGKSTLLKLLYNEQLVKQYCEYHGSIQKEGLRLGYLPQFIDEAWLAYSASDFLLKETPEEEVAIERYNDLADLLALASTVQLSAAILEGDQIIATLSGGEKMKLQLLKLLHAKPDVLLLDEPTNDLDIETLEWLEEFLLATQVPLLFISHDETLLERVANGILHLEQLEKKKAPKHTFERLGYQEYVQKRYHLIDRQNMISRKEKAEHEKQLEKWRQIYQKVEHRQATITRQDPHGGQLLKKKMKSVKAMKRRIDKEEITGKIEPEESISLFFDDFEPFAPSKIILDYQLDQLQITGQVLATDISLFIKGQDKIVLFGKNGVGKTTLLKKLYAELKKKPDLRVGYMPQTYEELLACHENAITFLAPDHDKETINKARTMLGNAKFTVDEMERPLADLSGGQKAKLVLIHLIMSNVNVLVLDEPTRNLSPLSNPVIRNMLIAFPGVILSVSHDRKFIEEVADTCYELTAEGLTEYEKRIS